MSLMPGKPRGLQRAMIVEHFKTMGVGDILPHAKIEELIGIKRDGPESQRYYGIVSSAIKAIEREQGIRLHCEQNEGYKYPTGEEQLKAGVKVVHHGIKKMGRGARTVGFIADDRLTPAGIQARDHSLGVLSHIKQFAATHVKALTLHVSKPDVKPQLPPPKK